MTRSQPPNDSDGSKRLEKPKSSMTASFDLKKTKTGIIPAHTLPYYRPPTGGLTSEIRQIVSQFVENTRPLHIVVIKEELGPRYSEGVPRRDVCEVRKRLGK